MGKISAMTVASAAADADLVPIVQGGVNKQATVSQVRGRLHSVRTSNDTNGTLTPATTGLSIDLLAGHTYKFICVLYVSAADAADGYRVDFDGGGATATAFRVFGTQHNGNGTTVKTHNTAPPTLLATDMTFAAASSSPDMLVFHGAITVNVAGTFIPRYAKNTDSAGALLTLLALSNIVAEDIT